MHDASGSPRLRFSRGSGLAVLALLVILGMGIPAYLQWMVPRLEASRDRLLAEAPTEPEGRLEYWFRFGQPMIHGALMRARFSPRQPWYVSHVVTAADPDLPPEVWGIDLMGLDHETAIRREGLTVRLVLDEPRLLAREELRGTHVQGIPRFAAGQSIDAADLATRRLARYPMLTAVAEALGRDIPEARFVIQVGDAQAEVGDE